MYKLILGLAAVACATTLASAMPASAMPISPVAPLAVETDEAGVTPISHRWHNRGFHGRRFGLGFHDRGFGFGFHGRGFGHGFYGRGFGHGFHGFGRGRSFR